MPNDQYDVKNLTEDQKSALTPEELAGMEEETDESSTEMYDPNTGGIRNPETVLEAPAATEEEADDDEPADKGAGPDDKAAGGDDDLDVGDGDPEAAAARRALEEARGEGEAETAAEAEAVDVSALPPAQQFDAEAAKKRMGEIDTQLADLDKQFYDGDIDAAQHRADTRKLIREQDKLQDGAESQEAQLNTWYNSTVKEFTSSTEKVGAGASPSEFYSHASTWAMLNEAVKRVQGQAIVAGKNPFDPKVLQIADKMVRTELAKVMGVDPAATPPGKDTKKPAAAPKRPEMPPTLRDTPAADAETVDYTNQFAHLDRLDGEAFEKALAALPVHLQTLYLEQ